MIKNVGRWFAVITMIEVSRFLNGRCYDVWNCIYLSKNPQRHIVVAIRRFCETRYRTDGRSKNFGGHSISTGSFDSENRVGFLFLPIAIWIPMNTISFIILWYKLFIQAALYLPSLFSFAGVWWSYSSNTNIQPTLVYTYYIHTHI